MKAPTKPERDYLFSRELLERLANAEQCAHRLAADVSLVVSTRRDLDGCIRVDGVAQEAVPVLCTLARGAKKWARQAYEIVDPTPGADGAGISLRTTLLALRNHLALMQEYNDVLLAALPKDGAA